MSVIVSAGKARFQCLLMLLFFATASSWGQLGDGTPGRDPKQPIDVEYTKKILEYTTQPIFASPLVDYLPAS